jgi:hypothetical protein
MLKPVRIIGALLSLMLISGLCYAAKPAEHIITPQSPGNIIQNIRGSTSAFNPSAGEKVVFRYLLAIDAKVTFRVYDPDRDLVATLADKQPQAKGENAIVWEGRDLEGKIVPDEAYFVTIEAVDAKGQVEVYDPTVFSGGKEADLTKADIDPESGTITYRLPEMGRVRIRIGIGGGPLAITLVDWKPRLAGEVTEYWNSKDQDNLIDVYRNPRFKMIITYFTLPQDSIIAYGNNQTDYVVYKEKTSRPKKKEYPAVRSGDEKISPHYTMSRIMDRSPGFSMDFPNKVATEEDIPVLQGKSVVHVELDEQSKKYFQEMKYEICFFLNDEFYAEEESGYSPYNWVWDTSQAEEGTYVLTVNLSSFKDQVAVSSRKVKVVR